MEAAATPLVENGALQRGLSYLECTICFDVPRPNTKIKCCSMYGHLVCQPCWLKMFRGVPPPCPTCRACNIPIEYKHFTLCNLFEEIAQGLTYNCKYEEFFCEEKILGRDLVRHELVCPERPSSCPGISCSKQAPYPWFESQVPSEDQFHHQNQCFVKNSPRRLNEWIISVDSNLLFNSATGNWNKTVFKSQLLLSGRHSLESVYLPLQHKHDVRMCVRLYTRGTKFNVAVVWMENEKTARALRVADPKIRVELFGHMSAHSLPDGTLLKTPLKRPQQPPGARGGVEDEEATHNDDGEIFTGKPIFQDTADRAPWNEQNFFLSKKTVKELVSTANTAPQRNPEEEGKRHLILFRVRLLNGGILK